MALAYRIILAEQSSDEPARIHIDVRINADRSLRPDRPYFGMWGKAGSETCMPFVLIDGKTMDAGHLADRLEIGRFADLDLTDVVLVQHGELLQKIRYFCEEDDQESEFVIQQVLPLDD